MDEFVSIVVAAKNSLPWLRRLTDALQAAPLPGAALIIVDGASGDGTAEWLRSRVPAGELGDVRWVSEPDAGIADAWNRGVALAKGEWVVFLGADDLPGEPAAWSHAIARLRGLPESCDVAAFPVTIVSQNGTPIEVQMPTLGPDNRDFFAFNTLPHQGVFHRRRLWQRYGAFDGTYPVACDYEFLVRALVAGAEVRVCDGAPPFQMTFGGASKHDPLGNLREFRRVQIAHHVRRFHLQWWLAWARATVRAMVQPLLGESATRRLADCARRVSGRPRAWTAP